MICHLAPAPRVLRQVHRGVKDLDTAASCSKAMPSLLASRPYRIKPPVAKSVVYSYYKLSSLGQKTVNKFNFWILIQP